MAELHSLAYQLAYQLELALLLFQPPQFPAGALSWPQIPPLRVLAANPEISPAQHSGVI